MIAADTSWSSRWISRGPFSTTVTSAAEAAVHLRKLKPNVAAADDDEVPRHAVELEDRGVGQVGDDVDAGHVGTCARPPTLRKMRALPAARCRRCTSVGDFEARVALR